MLMTFLFGRQQNTDTQAALSMVYFSLRSLWIIPVLVAKDIVNGVNRTGKYLYFRTLIDSKAFDSK